MATVEEIEAAIQQLPRKEFLRVLPWLKTRSGDEWDCQIENDVRAGGLDRSASKALAEYHAGRTAQFPAHEEPRDQ
jgi:hypothetical protein